MKITFLGQSAFLLEHDGHKVAIDPWLTGNPKATVNAADVNVEAILVSHGHNDHFGDTLDIAKRTGATVVSNAEIADYCEAKGANAHAMHIGGGHAFPFGWVKLTPAWHGSAIDRENPPLNGGNPCGFVVKMGEKTVYHSGDTALFGDMALIGSRHPMDAALLPIGDNFTMGPDDALYAAELLKTPVVVPMHYNTFELLNQDVDDFARRVRDAGRECVVLDPGQSFDL